jgi:hypothetical protein
VPEVSDAPSAFTYPARGPNACVDALLSLLSVPAGGRLLCSCGEAEAYPSTWPNAQGCIQGPRGEKRRCTHRHTSLRRASHRAHPARHCSPSPNARDASMSNLTDPRVRGCGEVQDILQDNHAPSRPSRHATSCVCSRLALRARVARPPRIVPTAAGVVTPLAYARVQSAPQPSRQLASLSGSVCVAACSAREWGCVVPPLFELARRWTTLMPGVFACCPPSLLHPPAVLWTVDYTERPCAPLAVRPRGATTHPRHPPVG